MHGCREIALFNLIGWRQTHCSKLIELPTSSQRPLEVQQDLSAHNSRVILSFQLGKSTSTGSILTTLR